MLQENSDNLDALIREEKHRVALEFFQDAWNSAIQEGIEPSILAESAIVNALTNLSTAEGDGPVAALITDLPDRNESGHFIADRRLQ